MAKVMKTKSGRPLTAEYQEELARRAEAGPDPERLRRGGRPSLDDEGISPRIQLRLARPLYEWLEEQAREKGTTVSAIVRHLLEQAAKVA
jgi:hypothetical protein